jgi:hypothetical protein
MVVSGAAGTAGTATAAQLWRRAVQIRLPAGIGPNVNADLTAVACVRTGFCTAAGTYQHGSQANRPLAVTESHQRWGRARKLQLPANAVAQTFAVVRSVACTSASSCVVVGSYIDGGVFGDQLAFLATESHGRWARARQRIRPVPPDGSQDHPLNPAIRRRPSCPQLQAVACPLGHSPLAEKCW